MSSLKQQPAGLPDLRWINRKLPIIDIAHRLDLRFQGPTQIHCWHPERHQHADRTASVGIRGKNNTVKCFGCGSKPMGPIDLVMDVLQFSSAGAAALWIADRFDVPRLPKGRHLVESNRRGGRRSGFEGELGVLIQSGLWARLSPSARGIAPVFAYFADRVPGQSTAHLTISYLAITRYSGVASPNAIAGAVRELCGLGWMQRDDQDALKGQIVQDANQFLLTPESDELHELAQAHAQQMKNEIVVERELRKQQRAERLQTLKTQTPGPCAATKYKTLYSENSVERNSAIPGIAAIRCEWRNAAVPTFADVAGSSLVTMSQGRRLPRRRPTPSVTFRSWPDSASCQIGTVRGCGFALIRGNAELSGGRQVQLAVAV